MNNKKLITKFVNWTNLKIKIHLLDKNIYFHEREICWILPMSSKNKDNPYYHKIYHQRKIYSVILTQIKLISSKRLLRKIRTLSEKEFNDIKASMKFLL